MPVYKCRSLLIIVCSLLFIWTQKLVVNRSLQRYGFNEQKTEYTLTDKSILGNMTQVDYW